MGVSGVICHVVVVVVDRGDDDGGLVRCFCKITDENKITCVGNSRRRTVERNCA